jgi:hypothetical protein
MAGVLVHAQRLSPGGTKDRFCRPCRDSMMFGNAKPSLERLGNCQNIQRMNFQGDGG